MKEHSLNLFIRLKLSLRTLNAYDITARFVYDITASLIPVPHWDNPEVENECKFYYQHQGGIVHR